MTTVGRTFLKATPRILGEGTFPRITTCVPVTMARKRLIMQLYTWAMGRKQRRVSLDLMILRSIQKVRLPAKLFPESMTPLLKPVVPEV